MSPMCGELKGSSMQDFSYSQMFRLLFSLLSKTKQYFISYTVCAINPSMFISQYFYIIRIQNILKKVNHNQMMLNRLLI